MNIKILHMVEGAKQATGLTVIIDVFRAFTVEAYLMNNGAEKILTGSLVNAKAIVKYIKNRKVEDISLVCMGLEAISQTEEDNLCAYYIKSLLENNPIPLDKEIEKLKITSGAKFFDKNQQDVFPERDFYNHQIILASVYKFDEIKRTVIEMKDNLFY